MTGFGTKASQLCQDLAKAEEGKFVPFNNDLFEQAMQECSEHYSQVESLMGKIQEAGLDVGTSQNADHFGALIHHLSIIRNKRCLMAYMYKRAQKTQDLRWKLGAILPDDVQQNLNHSEREFFKDYSDCLGSYFTDMDIDLTVDMAPPKDPYVNVKVVRSVGDLLLEEQAASLTRNSIHLLKRSEIEIFLSQGIMEEFYE